MAVTSVSTKVLANKGVPVEVYALKKDEDGDLVWPPRAVLRSDETKMVEERFVRLGNLQIADLEDHFGGLDEWQEALRAKPFATIIKTLEVCWAEEQPFAGLPSAGPGELNLRRRAVGEALLDARMDEYATAIGGAFMLANGVEPDAVGKALKQGVAASQKTQERLMARLRLDQEVSDVELGLNSGQPAEQSDSTTAKPSEAGAVLDVASTSSGD